MKNLMVNLIIFVIIFIIYEFIFNKKRKNEYPLEVMILKNFYKLDINKVDYNKLLNILAFVSSFDITLIIFIISFIKSGVIQIIVAMILVLPIIFASYYFVSLFCKNK